MDAEKLLELEKAAVDLMSPPYAITEEARKKAERVFLGLKGTPMPYSACRTVLENSHSDYVQYQAASAILEAVMREWPLLVVEEKEKLWRFIVHFLTSRADLANYVREQLLHVLALMTKRASLDPCKSVFFSFFLDAVHKLLGMENIKMRLLSSFLVSAVLSEFSSSSSSSYMGLSFDFHLKSKKVFEAGELLKVLNLTVRVLQQYCSVEWSALSHHDLSLFTSFLKILSQILQWNFQHTSVRPWLFASPDTLSSPFKPPKSFSPVLLDPCFLQMLLRLLLRALEREEAVLELVLCLTQLASLSSPLLSTDSEQQTYLLEFISGILDYLSKRSDLSQQEVYGFSCVLRRLSATFPSQHFSHLPPSQLQLLIHTLTRLTCLSAQRAAVIARDSLDYPESLEHFLEVWVNILGGAESLPDAVCVGLLEVFHAYVQSKLCAPRGWRSLAGEGEEELLDVEEADSEAYADQLCSVGFIARLVPARTLPLLLNLLDKCTSDVLHVLSVVHLEPSAIGLHLKQLESLFEDVYWLLLVCGYSLCDIVQGEEVLIPTQLMQFSIQNQSNTFMDTSVVGALLREEGCGSIGEIPSISSLNLDPIVALVLAVCRLCVVEKAYVKAGLLEVWSPQVCETSVWFLSSVVEPYLMLNETSYEQVSLPLATTFGKSTEASKWLTLFVVEKVAFNLSVWYGEERVSLATIKLLCNLVKSPERARVAIMSDTLWSLMRQFSSDKQLACCLSPAVQRELMSGLVQCGVGEKKQLFYAELLQPLYQRFVNLVQRGDFAQSFQETGVQRSTLATLEALCGLAQTSCIDSIPDFFSFLLPVLQTSTHLIQLYCNDSEVTSVILQLFSLVAENYVIFLNETQTVQLYQVSLDLICTYARCNTGKYSQAALLAEEEQCEDLLLVMRLLSSLTSRDLFDFTEDSTSLHPADVVIAGVHTILPLMNEELLKYPSLSREFYTLLQYMCRFLPEKIAVLPDRLYQSCVCLLERGLENCNPSVPKLCLESVESLACHCFKTSPTENLSCSLKHFLKVLFELMLKSCLDMDLTQTAACTTFALICCQKECYASLVDELVGRVGGHLQPTLITAFGHLTPPSLTLDLSRASRAQFRKNLEEFLQTVKGLLCFR